MEPRTQPFLSFRSSRNKPPSGTHHRFGHEIMTDQEKRSLDSSGGKSWQDEARTYDARGLHDLNSISSSYPKVSPRPLIDSVKNGWMTATKKYKIETDDMSGPRKYPASVGVLFSIIAAPRFRRYLLVYVCLLCICFGGWIGFVSPRIREYDAISKALDPLYRDKSGGWFGSNALPRFSDMVYVRSLDSSLLPGDKPLAENDPNRKRLIIIGDVHGAYDELVQLLEHVNFDAQKGDHLIFTGDLIAKGPKSTEVVDLARKHSASCVRGNHEDRILLVRREMKLAEAVSKGAKERALAENEPDRADEDIEPGSKELALARQLSDEQAEWLDTCPVILKVGSIKDMGEVVVVHGGLVPGVDLEAQDPTLVMSMRTIHLTTHVPSSSSKGTSWTKLFNKYQKSVATVRETSPAEGTHYANPMTVIYGHDSQRSPTLKTYTKGLDTGCYKGGKLTAMIIEDGGESRIEQVKCKDYKSKS